MEVTIWGARGSIPSPGPDTVRYGGNTPCLEVRADGDAVVVLDAGTGIRALGDVLDRAQGRVRADILITHAHWDHVQGLPFFAPLYRSGNLVRVWASRGGSATVHRVVREQMNAGSFPVPFASLPADVRLETLPGEAVEIGGLSVQHFSVSHPGGAVGYRLVAGNGRGAALVYIPDNELSAPEAHGLDADWRVRLMKFVGGADLLVHDAMYTQEEYATHVRWGHSYVTEVVRLAQEAEVRRVALFHHHPSRSDAALELLLEQCRRDAGLVGVSGGPHVFMAAEGTTLTVE